MNPDFVTCAFNSNFSSLCFLFLNYVFHIVFSAKPMEVIQLILPYVFGYKFVMSYIVYILKKKKFFFTQIPNRQKTETQEMSLTFEQRNKLNFSRHSLNVKSSMALLRKTRLASKGSSMCTKQISIARERLKVSSPS